MPGPTPGSGRRIALAAGVLVAAWAALVGVLVLSGRAVVASDRVTAADRAVTTWVVAHRSAALDRVMQALTWTGTWVAALGLLAVLVFLALRRRIGVLALGAVAVGWAGVLAGVRLVKETVERPRPPEEIRLVTAHGWAFPSGHTANAVVIFATAATLVCLLVRRPAVRMAACALAVAVVGLVAFSRVELGVHWLSDVVASVLWTPCWLLASVSALLLLDPREGLMTGVHSATRAADPLRARRWLARAALTSVVLAIGVLLGFAGRSSLWLALVVAGASVVVAAACFWFLVNRGLLRWLALALALTVPAGVVVALVVDRLLWVVALAAALLAAGVQAARTALRPRRSTWALPVTDAPPPQHPFFVMNPRSGGGKVTRFGLADRARALGAEVVLLDQPGTDVQQLARDALAGGADLLGVAGGDGTQALVAQVAADHDVPFVVISAGTRNHFALDLGLDREDPVRCLDALRDGVEARIDLGEVAGRPFVNNASFGAYAEIVDNPDYRAEKSRTALETLPDLLTGRRGAHLAADVGGERIDGPQAVLVSNNPYEDGDLGAAGRRARLDGGTLGVLSIRVDSTRQAVGLLHHAHGNGLRRGTARQVTVEADAGDIPVGIDGEAVRLPTPVRCTIRPGALRVRLPRERPGIRPPRGRWDWTALWRLAVGRDPEGRSEIAGEPSGRAGGREPHIPGPRIAPREADRDDRPAG